MTDSTPKTRDERMEARAEEARKQREESLPETDKRFAKDPADWSEEDRERQEYTQPTWAPTDGRTEDELNWESKKAGREAEDVNAAAAMEAEDKAKKYREEEAESVGASTHKAGYGESQPDDQKTFAGRGNDTSTRSTVAKS